MMYTLRHVVHSCWSNGPISLKLLRTHKIAKIHCEVISRVFTTGNTAFETFPLRLRQQKNNIQQKRTLTKTSLSTFKPRYKEDEVPTDYELIYEASLGNTHVVAFFFLGFFILLYVGLIVYLYLLFSDNWVFDEQTEIPGTNMMVSTLGLKLSLSVLLFLTFWLYFGTRYARLPLQRIYEHPNKKDYIGILKAGTFKTERVEFNLSEVKGLASRAKLGANGNAMVKGRECLIYACDFKVPEQFNKILGFKQDQ